MKGRKRPWELFRLLVVPTMFLCAIVRHPATKAVAIVALVIWLGCLCSYFNSEHEPESKEAREAQRRKDDPMDAIVHELPQEDVFLLRQINFRITEMIKQVYPTVSWLWVRRPGVEELRSGGSWRLQLSETGPFNFAEANLDVSGRVEITMLQVVPLDSVSKVESLEATAQSEDLTESEQLDRTEASTWYSEYGSEILASIIDGLNPQGHKHLVIHEDGEIFVKSGSKDVAVNKLEWFLPRLAWNEISNLLREDDITATVEDQGLALSW